MKIIDSQVHFGPGGVESMLAAMDAVGVDAVVADEFWGLDNWGPGYNLPGGVLRVTTPTVELAAARYPDRFAYVRRVDPRDPEAASLVRMTADAPNALGIRVLPALTADELTRFTAGDYHEMFEAARDAGLPVFLYIAGHVELLPPYLSAFPEVTFIVDHCGMPMEEGISFLDAETPEEAAGVTTHKGPDTGYFTEVLKLADHPNVALKWSHAQGMFGVSDYPFTALFPFLRRAIDAFGADRIMWASDMGGNQTGESWAELLFYLKDSPEISDNEKKLLLGGTVSTLLNWRAE